MPPKRRRSSARRLHERRRRSNAAAFDEFFATGAGPPCGGPRSCFVAHSIGEHNQLIHVRGGGISTPIRDRCPPALPLVRRFRIHSRPRRPAATCAAPHKRAAASLHEGFRSSVASYARPPRDRRHFAGWSVRRFDGGLNISAAASPASSYIARTWSDSASRCLPRGRSLGNSKGPKLV